MPRGDKSRYSDNQKRKAGHIEASYESRGVPDEEAERRAWAMVNKESGGGNLSGSGRGCRQPLVQPYRREEGWCGLCSTHSRAAVCLG
jgi:hypothetical protein